MNTTRHLFSLCILAVFTLLALGSANTNSNKNSNTKTVQSLSPSYTLSADQLYQDYSANEVAADSKYRGKVVVVSGTIQSIGKGITDEAYIVIGGKGFLDGVQCGFPKGQEGPLTSLSKGQHVTVKGEVTRKFGNVLLRQSMLQ